MLSAVGSIQNAVRSPDRQPNFLQIVSNHHFLCNNFAHTTLQWSSNLNDYSQFCWELLLGVVRSLQQYLLEK